MRVPTEAEWGDYQVDMDRFYAHTMFAGRTNQEMIPHFRRNVLEFTSELRWMPQIPFRYYMLGFRDFVMATGIECLEASDAASCFLRLVLEKLEKQPDHILPIMSELLPALRHVAKNQAVFGAPKSIYGSFCDKLGQIERLWHGSSAESC